MERIKRSERFRDTYAEPETSPESSESHGTPETEAPEDLGMKFGETELSFSKLRPVEFNPDYLEGETEQAHEFRMMARDENVFIAGLLASERGEKDGMSEALKTGNFRIKRMQRREFLNAVANLSDEEYSEKINSVWGTFTTDQMRMAAARIATTLRDKALANAKDNAINASVNRPEPTRVETPSSELNEAEPSRPEISTPQLEIARNVYARAYRDEKQTRRMSNLLTKVKGLLSKVKDNKKSSNPEPPKNRYFKKAPALAGAPRPEGGYFSEPVTPVGRERPEEGYFGEPVVTTEAPRPENDYFDLPARRYHEEYDFDDYGEFDKFGIDAPDDFSMDEWYSRRSA